jgi:hypothetical protein
VLEALTHADEIEMRAAAKRIKVIGSLNSPMKIQKALLPFFSSSLFGPYLAFLASRLRSLKAGFLGWFSARLKNRLWFCSQT